MWRWPTFTMFMLSGPVLHRCCGVDVDTATGGTRLPPGGCATRPGRGVWSSAANDPSVSQAVFTIMEKAPTRAFSWLKGEWVYVFTPI